MIRSLVGLIVGLSLSLVLSTVALAVMWAGPLPRGSVPLSIAIAVVCIGCGGLIAGIVGEQRTLLLGGLVGLAVGALVGLWPGAFPLKNLFFEANIWRNWLVPITTMAGLLGGWLAGRLVAPGGLLTAD